MVSWLQRQIAEAIREGAELGAIDDALIEPARLDEEEKVSCGSMPRHCERSAAPSGNPP